jgi:hypothetical protein
VPFLYDGTLQFTVISTELAGHIAFRPFLTWIGVIVTITGLLMRKLPAVHKKVD